MSTQYTPGPWTADIGDCLNDDDDCWVIDSEQGSIAEMTCPADVEEANARLVAAAPDLLAASEATARLIEHLYTFQQPPNAVIPRAYIELKAAIAKATGK